MEVWEYITENALILVPALWVIGAIIKRVPKIPDWCIPFVLLIFGIAGAVGLLGFNVEGVLQGIFVTGAAVYGNQAVKQTKKAIEEME